MQLAEWDSAFFGKRIYSIRIEVDGSNPELLDLLEALREKRADGAYIFLSEPSANWSRLLENSNISLYDEKITYKKKLSKKNSRLAVSLQVEPFQGDVHEDLIKLSFEAGKYSRFKTDENLTGKFEELYRLWMEKSLNGSLADTVFIYRHGASIKGMITCKLEGGIGTVGLIAVNQDSQGKGIGKDLIAAAEDYFIFNQAFEARVVTQKDNHQACRFYEKSGYEILSVQPVYHVWLKNN